ncbi:MAG: SpoIID/LytB domain-containing protein [bacterium]
MEKKLTKKNIIITITLFVLSQLILIYCLFFFNGHGLRASAQEIEQSGLIRVGISTQDFGRLEYEKTAVTSDGQFLLNDKTNGTQIMTVEPFKVIKFAAKDDKIALYDQSGTIINEGIEGPVIVTSLSGKPIEIAGLKRGNKPAKYKGTIEITKASNRKNTLSVINVLPLEEYLKGVVPNEMPVSFGIEALKAQAVAARNYATRPRVYPYKQFDICDSVQCQVYYGAATESPLSNQAIEETKGIAALYEGKPILALYSSTAGGYTESYENAFTDANNHEFVKPLPYLKGKPDIVGIPPLNDEKSAFDFYSSKPETFDMNSNFYRWQKDFTKAELEDLLSKNLIQLSKIGLVEPKFIEGTKIVGFIGFETIERGVSGKVKLLKIMSENGEWVVKKELAVRRLLEKDGKMLPSANIVFSNQYDQQGLLNDIIIYGGGLGHGVGMSQFGAGYLSSKGWTFDNILKHYYDGISLGLAPISISSDNYYPIYKEFYEDIPKLTLNIDNRDKPEHIILSVNGTLLEIPELKKKTDIVKVNLDKFARKGNNNIVYYPLERSENNKSVKVWAEVIGAD